MTMARPTMTAGTKKSHLRTVLPLVGVLLGMAGLSYAAVPLYQLFCQVTGYGGTTQKADQAPGAVGGRMITVRFNSDTAPGIKWAFRPEQRTITVKIGEEKLAFYRAQNKGKRAVTGTAVFNVTPAKAGQYFNKIACFCFEEQRLEAGQAVQMPVSFFIDPAILKDRNLNDVDTITLSYTFFPAEPDAKQTASAGAGKKTD